MNPTAFIDANVPIYAAGRQHPYKEPCARVLRMVASSPEAFVTNAEVLQELLHYYKASGRWSLGREVVRNFGDLMQGFIEPVTAEDILLAASMADTHQGVSARDLVHAAVMKRLNAQKVISADSDFDKVDGVERLDPLRVDDWRNSVGGAIGG